MNIIVCIKQVPDTSEVRIDPVTNNLIREGIPSIINPFDLNGIEAALQIREKFGGKITVITLGPRQAEDALQTALGMGVDEVILVSDRAFAGSDTLATGYALAEAIRKLPYDLIFCGLEAIDGCTGQVGPIIAENLAIPQFTYISKIEVHDPLSIIVHREVRDGFQVLKTRLPAVVCVTKNINDPRSPVEVRKKVTVWDANEIGLNKAQIGINGSPTRVASIQMSDVRAKSYVSIDSSLSAEERIKAIINGGLSSRNKINLIRGHADELASTIIELPEFQKYLEI